MEKDAGKSREIKKIAIVGPESTGKSTLAMKTAGYYNTLWVPEYAREYIDKLRRPYQKDDLEIIARGQLDAEDEMANDVQEYLICDTNLIVIKIWSEYKFGKCAPWILKEIDNREYALHLLTYIDIPWADDPQREHPDKRIYFYNLYRKELENLGIHFVEIKGEMETRIRKAISAIDALQ